MQRDFEDVPVDVEPAEPMPDVLLSRVAEQMQQGLVRPHDDLVGPDLLHTFQGVLEEIS